MTFPSGGNPRGLSRRAILSGAPSAALLLSVAGCFKGPSGGWVEYERNPVLGGGYGTCFDPCVIKIEGRYRMWFSWRPKHAIAYSESLDGENWSPPIIAVSPDSRGEVDVNRCCVVPRGDVLHMWATSQTASRSYIFHATSTDGIKWRRDLESPILSPLDAWEGVSLMCPDVMWDERSGLYRMWYSGGEQYEPNAIGYCTSRDGKNWIRPFHAPVFAPSSRGEWDGERVTACNVHRDGDWHYMFYVGFRDINTAAIGIARSRDGVENWKRCPANPIIKPDGFGQWLIPLAPAYTICRESIRLPAAAGVVWPNADEPPSGLALEI